MCGGAQGKVMVDVEDSTLAPAQVTHVTVCGKDACCLVWVDVVGWCASLLIPRHPCVPG